MAGSPYLADLYLEIGLWEIYREHIVKDFTNQTILVVQTSCEERREECDQGQSACLISPSTTKKMELWFSTSSWGVSGDFKSWLKDKAWSGDSPAPYCANQGCWWWCETITIPVIDSIGDYLIFNVISDPRIE